jgi:hypothetical protein
MENNEYFKNYYQTNKSRYLERYKDNKQKKLDVPELPKDYYLNKLLEIGFVKVNKLNLKTYKDVYGKETYAMK